MSCYDSYVWWTPMCQCIMPHGALCLAECQVMLQSLRSSRQDASHHCGFGVPWTLASHMTGSSGRQPDQHWKGGLCRQQCCSPDAQRGCGDIDIWFRSRKCDAERWLLMAGSWYCDWRRSSHPWGSFYVFVHLSRQETVRRLGIDESVWPDEVSSRSWQVEVGI